MFRRILFLTAFCFGVILSPAYAWHIEDYKININLEKDSGFIVREEIHADFGYESKHGIYRDIPTSYQDENGKSYNVRFHLLSVQDEHQNRWQHAEEDNWNYKRIKIGSAYSTVSGQQTYIITYRVTGAVLFLSDHDELYWNAIGTQWDVNIHHALVLVYLPEPVSQELLKITAYKGQYGSKGGNIRGEITSDTLSTFEGENFYPNEGLTIVVGLPKGILIPPQVTTPTIYQNYSYDSYQEPLGPWALLIPVVAFFVMFNLWHRFGKDPRLNKSVVVEYKAPDDLKPAEIGTLTDGRVDQRDITSTIIDLAIRGYLKIVQEEGKFLGKEYKLVRLKDFEYDRTLKLYENKILRSIFKGTSQLSEVKLSELENEFYQNLGSIEEHIKGELRPKKYLADHFSFIVIIVLWTILSAVIFFLGVFTGVFSLWLMAALILTSVIIFLFGLVMPKRTIEQVQVLGKIAGFKEFLQRTEKDKIDRSDQQDIFERMLPYAICLGISTKWAKKFEGLYAQPPQWFVGGYGSVFVYDHFIHDLDTSLNRMGSSFYSSPQTVSSGGGFSGGGFSGGGGSSGGGFGGGGGGSW